DFLCRRLGTGLPWETAEIVHRPTLGHGGGRWARMAAACGVSRQGSQAMILRVPPAPARSATLGPLRTDRPKVPRYRRRLPCLPGYRWKLPSHFFQSGEGHARSMRSTSPEDGNTGCSLDGRAEGIAIGGAPDGQRGVALLCGGPGGGVGDGLPALRLWL